MSSRSLADPELEQRRIDALRLVRQLGDPVLRTPAAEVTEFDDALREEVERMERIMIDAHGVGLAAPQIGVGLRVVIFGFEHSQRYPDAPPVPMTILVNPVITPLSDDLEDGWEGCLSVPGLRGVVPRHTRIRYQGFTPDGAPIDRVAEGFHARVVQHECDHLVGRLYPTRMRDLTQLGFTSVLFPELDPNADD